jgi:hypothetical protein
MCRTKEGVPLVQAAAVQPEFEFHDVSGTPVGFWTPEREDAQRAGLSTCTSCRPTARAAVISYNGMVIYGPARNVKGLLNTARIGTDAVIYPALS